MNTGLAQLVALTAHGNIALANPAHRSGLEQSNLFQYVGQLSFGLETDPNPADSPTPDHWFAGLRDRGIHRLFLIRLPPEPDASLTAYDRSAFANGEQAAIAAVDRDGSMELWVPEWISAEHDGKHQWALRYHGYRGGRWAESLNGSSVTESREELRQVLREIAAFATGNGLERWAENFDGAAALLDPSSAEYNFDLLPSSGYDSEARRLLSAAMSGWVFGGMGSWNDTGPSDSAMYPRYETLTQRLYDTIMDALAAAANAYRPH